MKKNYKTYEEELGSLKKINFIQDKNILIFKKKKFSYYYDNLIKGIIDYGKPKKTIYIYYSSSSNYLEISKKIEEIIFKENINIFPLPGPSAVTTAISVCGFSEKYFFYGFFPEKSKTLKDDLSKIQNMSFRDIYNIKLK